MHYDRYPIEDMKQKLADLRGRSPQQRYYEDVVAKAYFGDGERIDAIATSDAARWNEIPIRAESDEAVRDWLQRSLDNPEADAKLLFTIDPTIRIDPGPTC